jgi:hypothetical protein
MLHANGFITAGTLAAVITLAACYNVLDAADTAAARQDARDRAAELGPLGSADAGALQHLGEALGTHVVWQHRLHEPDERMAADATLAALESTDDLREQLLELADAAGRSALEFLVNYNLAAGVWEARGGLVMGSPVLARMDIQDA